MDKKPIILFDGNCMLCNNFIQFILKHDRQNHLFISSHSLRGQDICLKYNLPQTIEIDTIYLIHKNKITSKSNAVLEILSKCGTLLKFISFGLYCIPTFIRDFCYGLISKNRHKIIKNKCTLITQEDLKRVILK